MGGDLEAVWRDILSSAKGLTPSGDGYDCRCPAHDDTRASLSITRTPEKILLHCHVGCEPARVALEFGYSLSDLGVKRDDGPRKSAAPEASWPVVKAYDYLDPDGILVYQVCRCEPPSQPATGKRQKTFKQRRPDGRGGWTWKVKGLAQYLYRLPRVLAAKPETPIFIVEGEKDVERLEAIGCVATCNPGGAGKWRKKYNAWLKGRPVVIVPDYDAPNRDTGKRTGTEHALTVAGELYGVAASVCILELPGLLEGQDVSDWLDAPHTAAEFVAAVEAASEWRPEIPLTTLANTPQPSRDERLERAEQDDSSMKVAAALRFDVLGELEDGRIKVFSEYLRKTIILKDANRLTYADMLQHFGEPVKAFVYKGQDEAPVDMFKVADVRAAVALLAGRRRIGDETEIGPGCWSGIGDDGKPQHDVTILVGAGEAAVLNGRPEPQRLSVPRYGGRLLELSGSRPWFDFDELTAAIAACTPEQSARTAREMEDLFGRWSWVHGHGSAITTGLVLSSWVQTLWPWRPQVAVIGKTRAGKTTLMNALESIFGGLVIRSADVTAAGLRQEVGRSASVILLDEFDRNRHRQQILDMLRASGLGDRAIRGTTGHKSQSFCLRHMVWLAGIDSGLKREPDRNRFIVLELDRPEGVASVSKMVSGPADAGALRLRSLATAIQSWRRAVALLPVLRDGLKGRHDERVAASYAVPAAMYAAAMGLGNDEAMAVHLAMLEGVANDDASGADENELLAAILQSDVNCGRGEMKTVAQIVNPQKFGLRDPDDEFDLPDLPHLERVGVTAYRDPADGDSAWLFIDHKVVTRKLLARTDWESATIEEVLKRIDGAKKVRRRLAGSQPRGVSIPMDHIRSL